MQFVTILFVCVLVFAAFLHAAPWPGEKSEWQGHERYDFKVEGRRAYVVLPKTPAPGNPWYWTAEFPTASMNDDLILLEKGWTLAHVDMTNRYGGPEAMKIMEAFHDLLTREHGLSPKPVLKGISRGGLFVFNYAAKHPDRVAAVYGDNPVCDFKSWPGGQGTGRGAPRDWQRLLEAYGFASEADALAYPLNPIDTLEPLAKARIPVLIVAGDKDNIVPHAENGQIVRDRYQKLGGTVEVILKPGLGHHPHGLKDPTPIVDFMLKYADYPGKPAPAPTP
jgi:pimeloyl-ACP methyl ester carboxylesterase